MSARRDLAGGVRCATAPYVSLQKKVTAQSVPPRQFECGTRSSRHIIGQARLFALKQRGISPTQLWQHITGAIERRGRCACDWPQVLYNKGGRLYVAGGAEWNHL
jgi:hypothetical protein